MSFEVKSHTPFGGKPSLLRFWQALLVCGVSAGGCSPGENQGRFPSGLRLEESPTVRHRYVAERMERARPERRQIYQTMFENMPFPSTMPGDTKPRWRIFDPSGAYLGMVETPERFRIYEIGPVLPPPHPTQFHRRMLEPVPKGSRPRGAVPRGTVIRIQRPSALI